MTNSGDDKDTGTKAPGRATSQGIGPTTKAGLALVGGPTPTSSDDGEDTSLGDILGDRTDGAEQREEEQITLGAPDPAADAATGFGRNDEATAVTSAEDLTGAAIDLFRAAQAAPMAAAIEGAASPSPPVAAPATSKSDTSTAVEADGEAEASTLDIPGQRLDVQVRETCRNMMREGYGGYDLNQFVHGAGYLFDNNFLWTLLAEGEALHEETPATDEDLLKSLSERRREVFLELAQREEQLTAIRVSHPDISDDDLESIHTDILGIGKWKTPERGLIASDTQELVRRELERRQGVKDAVIAAGTPAPAAHAAGSTALGTAPTVATTPKDPDLTPGPEALAAASSLASPLATKTSGPPPGNPMAPLRRNTPRSPVSAAPAAATGSPDSTPSTVPDGIFERVGEIEVSGLPPSNTGNRHRSTQRVAFPIADDDQRPEQLTAPRNRTGLFMVLGAIAVVILIGAIANHKSSKMKAKPQITALGRVPETKPVVVPNVTNPKNPVETSVGTDAGSTVLANAPAAIMLQPTDAPAPEEASVAQTTGAGDVCKLIPEDESEVAHDAATSDTEWHCKVDPQRVPFRKKGGEMGFALRLCPPNCTKLRAP